MFYAIDPATGTVMWRYDISRDGPQKSFHGRMLLADTLAFIGSDVPTGHVYAFETRTGLVRWKHFAGKGVAGDIVGLESYLYALTKEDTVLCLDKGTGEIVWRFHTAVRYEGTNDSSPCLSGDSLFFRGLDKHVYALDARSGETVWKRKLPDALSTSPSIYDDRVYVGAFNGYIYCLSKRTGEMLGSILLEDVPFGTIDIVGGRLLVLTGYRRRGTGLSAVDSDLKEIKWIRRPEDGSFWTTDRPSVWDGHVVVGSSRGDVAAFGIIAGGESWSLSVPGVVTAIARVGARYYIGTVEGVLHAFTAVR
ncbi:MAG: PQQ-binding-like beta-propeller repeat protein [bacterium]|nr:MAG: PQQ-binding-like beta-propeller repeat protein [bacterium]